MAREVRDATADGHRHDERDPNNHVRVRESAVIAVENLTHRYGERVALDAVSFAVQRGELFGLLGPNGGGKTTLFRVLTTLMKPSDGRVLMDGGPMDRRRFG